MAVPRQFPGTRAVHEVRAEGGVPGGRRDARVPVGAGRRPLRRAADEDRQGARVLHETSRGGMNTPESKPADLSELFGTPKWLRDLGTSAWLAVGIAVFIVAVMAVLSLTRTITM